MKIELEIKDKNYEKIPSILVMGAIDVKSILFVDFDSFQTKLFKIETAPANQVLGIF